MRILYVGPLQPGSTTLQRMHALEGLGQTPLPFDTTSYQESGRRVARSLRQRTAWGAEIRRLNSDIEKAGRSESFDWVWIDKGVWIYPETLEGLKRRNGAVLIHYTPDPALVNHKTRHFVRSIPIYDILITSKSYELDLYRAHGAKNLVFLQQGFDRDIFHPYELTAEEIRRLGSDVCFIGHCEGHYYRTVKAIASVVPNLAVWGRWGRRASFHPWLRRIVRGTGVWTEEYAKALCSTKVALGLLSKLHPDTSTTRTFEIPACGTFLLAERTDEHLELFREGIEAEYFGSIGELRDKIRYYLKNEEIRTRIAAAGRERCLRSGYSYHDRLASLLRTIADR